MIRFIKCTAQQYESATKSADDFYFVDGEKFYLGEILLSNDAISGYLTEVVAADASITVTNNNQIKVNISSKPGNNLSLVTESGKEGLYISMPAATDYTVSVDENSGGAGDVYSKRYTIKQGATGSASTVGTIDIPKDMVVSSGSVVDIVYRASDNTLHEGSESGTDVTALIKGAGVPGTAADAGKYIKLIIANATSSILYIAAKSLVDIYTAQPNATQVQLAIDANNVISASIVGGSIDSTAIANNAITTDKLDSAIVSELNKAESSIQNITTGTNNGTIKVDNVDVAVAGLGTAAFTNANAYATAAQGALAGSAVQNITSGVNNGTINVDGTEVYVTGLDSAAFASVSDFDGAGSAAAALTSAIGTSSDTSTANTIYGAKAYADSILTWTTLS